MLSKEPLAFATTYDSQDLLIWMNLFLDQVTLDGRLQKNFDYWVNSDDWKKGPLTSDNIQTVARSAFRLPVRAAV